MRSATIVALPNQVDVANAGSHPLLLCEILCLHEQTPLARAYPSLLKARRRQSVIPVNPGESEWQERGEARF